MSEIPAINAVIFDWGGTLTPWHSVTPGDAWMAAVSDADLAQRLAAAEQEVWQRTLADHRSGTLAEVFHTAGVDPTDDMLGALSRWWTR